MARRDDGADVCDRRLGPKETNEGFTEPYDLPNETAYAETCASVALIFWAHRMLHLDLDGRYADVMELALYNGALSGLARDGDALLLFQSAREPRPAPALGLARLPLLHDERVAPGRVGRRLCRSRRATTASPSTSMAAFETTVDVRRRRRSRCARRATIPGPARSGSTIDPEAPAAFDLKLRIPGWAKGATAAVNGEPIALVARRRLRDDPPALAQGRRVTLDLQMPAERLYAHPNVRMDVGRAALQARPVDLLRRGGRQSRRPGPDPGAAALKRRSTPNGGRTCSAAP